jgi:hypothetical protein
MPRHDWSGIARHVLFASTVTVLIVLLIVLLPVIIPLAEWSHSVYRKRLIAAARSLACLSCGAVLGLESIRLADAACEERMRELRVKHPAIRFRVVQHIHAICPVCGAQYTFLERERALVPTLLAQDRTNDDPKTH